MEESDYFCSECNQPTPRDELTAKKAVFLEIGEGARTIRSRTTAWLCPPCVVKDADWKRSKFDTPFMRSQKKENSNAG